MTYTYSKPAPFDMEGLILAIGLSSMTDKAYTGLRYDTDDTTLSATWATDLSVPDKAELDSIVAGL